MNLIIVKDNLSQLKLNLFLGADFEYSKKVVSDVNVLRYKELLESGKINKAIKRDINRGVYSNLKESNEFENRCDKYTPRITIDEVKNLMNKGEDLLWK